MFKNQEFFEENTHVYPFSRNGLLLYLVSLHRINSMREIALISFQMQKFLN